MKSAKTFHKAGKGTLLIISMILLVCILAGCKTEKKVTTGEVNAVRDEDFGFACPDMTIEDFNDCGFAFGDSVNVAFSNGVTLEDIPYYSGYYVPSGELLVCGYPGYKHVVIGRNFGGASFEQFGLDENSKVTVTLNEKGKYMDIQELYDLMYSDYRKDFDSDQIFANFREIKGGNIRAGMFYRSVSPCDNQHNRAAYANRFAEEYGIGFVMNLSDNETKYTSYVEAEDFDSAYYDSLYKDGKVLLLSLNANYRADEFAGVVSEALYEMTKQSEPALVHCVEGKDRTGFVCALMLALSDASAQEIIDDYMITYDNYYGITKEKKPEKNNAVLGNVNDFFYCMCDVEKGCDIDTLDLKTGAENYLRRGGLSDSQIREIEGYLTE